MASTLSNSKNETNTQSQGTSNSQTTGGSTTNSHTSSSTVGGSHSETSGKTWASGKVDAQTQAGFDQYNVGYTQGQAVQDAYNRLQQTLDNKPGAFQSGYTDMLNNMYNQIMNQGKFSYDFNADQMYKLQAAEYQKQGKAAMQNTMGQAAALTGGYGSSYAQTAGQQTYQNYLSELNSQVIPQLRNAAYQQYQDERADLYNRFGITNDMYNKDYQRYRDTVADWRDDRSFDRSTYQDERDTDFNQFAANRDYYAAEYWREKNAEQSHYSVTDTDSWSNTESDTTSNTSSWSNTIGSTTNNTSSISNTSSSSNSYGSGSSSSNSSKDDGNLTWKDIGMLYNQDANGSANGSNLVNYTNLANVASSAGLKKFTNAELTELVNEGILTPRQASQWANKYGDKTQKNR